MNHAVLPYTILIVEDYDIARTAMRLLLEDRGHNVFDVNCGQDALACCAELADRDASLDIALVDLGLPDTRGNQLIEELRASVEIGQVIYCSGCSRDEPEVQHLLATDKSCAYFEKPVRLDELLAYIHKNRTQQ